jgi:hypothetical protein
VSGVSSDPAANTGARRSRRWRVLLVVGLVGVLGLGACGGHDGADGLDRYGGWRAIHTRATGRFRVEQIDGVWWFVTPEGNAFVSLGVNFITPAGDFSPALGRAPYHDNILLRYGNEATWADETVRRLQGWGFNTAGAWSDSQWFRGRVPYCVIIDFEGAAPEVPWVPSITPRRIADYFAPEFESGVVALAEQARGCAADPYCIGVFVGNEMAWGPGLQQRGTYLDVYMSRPATSAAKQSVVDFLRRRYADDIAKFDRVWQLTLARFEDLFDRPSLPHGLLTDAQRADHVAFTEVVAARFFSRTYDALRAVDPQLLILGARFFSFQTLPVVFAAAAPFVDVVSLNDYDASADLLELVANNMAGRDWGYLFLDGPFADLERVEQLTQRPLMITEYFYRVGRPGVASRPVGLPEVATREAQADAFARYATTALARAGVIGAHWFQYFDQPVTGRFDGENQLIGLVDIDDEPYPLLTARMHQVNAASYPLHGAGS